MNPLYKHLLAAATALIALIAALPGPPLRSENGGGELTLYAAAALRAPIEAAATEYEARRSVKIRVHYGGSNTLLNQIEVGGRGDLFLAADATYLYRAQEKSLAGPATPLARMSAVAVVPIGAASRVESLEDLLGLRLALANPDQAAVGAAVRSALLESGDWNALRDSARDHGVFKPTVGEVLNDVKLGAVDAGIVWDAVAAPHADLRMIELPELASATGEVGVCVLRSSRSVDAAERFIRYLATDGRRCLVESGFRLTGAE